MLLVKKLLVEMVLTNQIARLKEHQVPEARPAKIIIRAHKVKHRVESPQLLVQKLMLNLSHRR